MGDQEWQLLAPLVYQVSAVETYTVPAGFRTDLASIPRIFFLTTPPIGAYDQAAVLHDWLYNTQAISRAQADGIFRQAMMTSGVGWYTRTKMYVAVRIFGAPIWKAHASSIS